jgi:flagellar L-ring protein precursor FlgH
MMLRFPLLLTVSVAAIAGPKIPFQKAPQKSALDQYIEEAHKHAATAVPESPGSLWSRPADFIDLAADIRARRVDDVVTVVVNEAASAVSTGTTKTQRQTSASASISSIAGPRNPAGALANLLQTNGNQQLDGSGTTTRQTNLTATLTARVTDVLPNGYLVIEGSKTVLVNSENQAVTLRGIVRPADLSTGNLVFSNNVAQMELKINGHGVVNDAIRRPNFLYRLLLGILPF